MAGRGRSRRSILTAELVSLAPGISPGGDAAGWAGVDARGALACVLGERGGTPARPPKIKWTLPEGITAGPMLFPIPQRLPLGPLMDFWGIEDAVAFPVMLHGGSGIEAGAGAPGCAW